jgi:hypothetical protein
MTIQSTVLANGQQSDVTQYNNLRQDLLVEHTHDGSEGGIVSHGNLGDGVISGTYLNHAIINKHIQGAGTDDDPDENGGGSVGVHGLPDTAYVTGSLSTSRIIQSGSSTTSGTVVISGTSYVDQTGNVTFPTAFSSAPFVYITPISSYSTTRIGVVSVSTTGFTARIGYPYTYSSSRFDTQFYWVAIGVV